MDLNIEQEDISINPDGSIVINNPELKAKINEIATESDESINKATNNCYGGNCKAGCGVQLR